MTLDSKGMPRGRGSGSVKANYDRAQMDKVDWDNIPRTFGRTVLQAGTWKVVVTERLQRGCCYVNSAHRVLAVHPLTWRTISFSSEAEAEFLRSMTGGASGMKFITMDAGSYGEAARAEAIRDAAVTDKDPLVELNQRAESLIVQASGLAGGASQVQMSIFMERYVELQAQLETMEDRLARARGLVELARDAVMDAV